jgi:hypothetical protein
MRTIEVVTDCGQTDDLVTKLGEIDVARDVQLVDPFA